MLLGAGEERSYAAAWTLTVSVIAYLTSQLHKFFAIWVHDMNGAGDTRIEAVDRALDLQRLLGIVEGVTIHERRLIGPRLALGSRGPAFQVDGTTAW